MLLSSKLSLIDTAFIKSLNNQSLLIRNNINRIVTKKNINTVHTLFKNLNNIEQITAKGRYSRAIGIDKTFNLSLKELDLIFPDDALIRVQRTILVNPKKIHLIRLATRDSYEIMTKSGHLVSIGSVFLPKIKETLSPYFKKSAEFLQ